MTFSEVFESLKSHRYLRRKSWSPKLFVNLRHTVPLIRLVMFTADKYDIKTIKILSNDIRLCANDLLADDWEILNNSLKILKSILNIKMV